MKKILFYILACTGILLAQGGSGSFGAFDPVSYGMANTYVASARGVYTLGKNPANLTYSDPTSSKEYVVDFSVPVLPTVMFNTKTNFITLEDINYFFGGVKDATGKTVGRTLTTADKQRFKNMFDGDGKIDSYFSMPILAFTVKASPKVGAFGFAINDKFAADLTVDKNLINFILDGNSVDQVNSKNLLSLNNTQGKMGYVREYSLSYARELPELKQNIFTKLAFGISLKMVQGFAYAYSDYVNSSVTTEYDPSNANIVRMKFKNDLRSYVALSKDFNVKYDFDSTMKKSDFKASAFPSPAGSGFGFDLGFSGNIMDNAVHLGFAITDIGSINWDDNVAKYESNREIIVTTLTDQDQRDKIKDSLKLNGSFSNSFSTSLPTALRMGVAVELEKFIDWIPGKMMAAFDYNQGFNDELGNSKKPRVSLGLNWNPPSAWAPYVRTGFSAGGRDGFNWALGMGFDAKYFEFNISTLDAYTLFGVNSTRKFNLAMGTRWKI